MIEGIIFDLDGTLLASMHIWNTVASEYLKKNGFTPDPDTDELMKEATVDEVAKHFRARYGMVKGVEEIAREIDGVLKDAYFHEITPKAGVLAMLERFKVAGIKMAAATATDRYLIEPCCKRLGIFDYFTAFFTCKEVGREKSDPLIYHTAEKALGVKKEKIAVFEDALYAAHTAKNDGYFLVGIYDDSVKDRQEEMKALCDLYVPSYEAVDVAGILLA